MVSVTGSSAEVHQGQTQDISRAIALIGGSGMETVSKFIHIFGSIQFLALVEPRFLFPCWLLVRDWYLLLEAACIPFHAFWMAENVAGWALFLLMSLTPPFTTSLLPPARWSSLFVRAQMIRFSHLDNREKSPYFKVSNLDYICKVPLSV